MLSLSVDYKSSARFGDDVDITVSFDKYTGARLFLSYEMKDAATGRLLAAATSSHCFISLETGAPVLIKSYYPEWNAALLKASRPE